MFKDPEERSKFFDVIISVMPSISTNNMFDIVNGEIKNKIDSDNLDQYMINAFVPYIDNHRILIDILNDYLLYRKELEISDNENLNQLFALMVLKNINPIEFEKLQKCQNESHNKSTIYDMLHSKKEEIIDKVLSKVYEEINKKMNEIKEVEQLINHGTFIEMNILKKTLYGCLSKHVTSSNKNHFLVEIDDNFPSFKDVVDINYKYKEQGYFSSVSQAKISLSQLEKTYFGEDNFFYNHEIKYQEELKGKIQNLKTTLGRLITNQSEVKSLSLMDLFKKYPEYKESITDNFIKLVLVNGYINENYYVCLSKEKNIYYDESALETIDLINRGESIEVDKYIKNPSGLIQILDPQKFDSNNVINYYLIKELFDNPSTVLKKYKDNFIWHLINCFSDALKKVFNSNLNSVKKNDLIHLFLSLEPTIWKTLYNDYYDKKIVDKDCTEILSGLENKFPDMNLNGSLSSYLSTSICFDFKNVTKQIFDDICKEKKVVFKKLSCVENEEIVQCALKNNMYEKSFDNILYVIEKTTKSNYDDIIKKNYQTVISCDESIKEYILNPINEYIEIIYSRESIFDLDQEYLDQLIINDDISYDNKILIISKETCCPTYSESFSKELLVHLLENNKLRIVNVEDYLTLISKIDEALLINYFEKVDIIAKIGKSLFDNSLNKLKIFIFNNIDVSKHIGVFDDYSISILDFEKNCQNVSTLLKNNKIKYLVEDYKKIKDIDTKKTYIEHYKTQIIENLENKTIDYKSEIPVLLDFKIIDDELFNMLNRMSNDDFKSLVEANIDNDLFIKNLNNAKLKKNKISVLRSLKSN